MDNQLPFCSLLKLNKKRIIQDCWILQLEVIVDLELRNNYPRRNIAHSFSASQICLTIRTVRTCQTKVQMVQHSLFQVTPVWQHSSPSCPCHVHMQELTNFSLRLANNKFNTDKLLKINTVLNNNVSIINTQCTKSLAYKCKLIR